MNIYIYIQHPDRIQSSTLPAALKEQSNCKSHVWKRSVRESYLDLQEDEGETMMKHVCHMLTARWLQQNSKDSSVCGVLKSAAQRLR